MSCLVPHIICFDRAYNKPEIRLIDTDGNDITMISTYSWSNDNVCFTGWTDYNTFRKSTANMESDFYIRCLIHSVIDKVYIDNALTSCYHVTIQSQAFLENPCDNPNLWQPYQNLDCALLLQQQMADLVCCTFGIPCIYCKYDPDMDTADFNLKEFVTHHLTGVKQLKLMIEDGQMPSSNPQATDMDFLWDDDWHVEISKTQFAAAFGDTAIPKNRDIVFVPMMNRIWGVNAAYDEKNEGLMYRSTTWTLHMSKYENNTNSGWGDWQSVVDNWADNKYMDTFFPDKEEAERVSAEPQTREQPKNLQNLVKVDAIRAGQKGLVVKPGIVCDRNTIVARNHYEFQYPGAYMDYQKEICGDEGTIIMLLETPQLQEIDRTIARFGEIEFEFLYKDESFYIGTDNIAVRLNPLSTYILTFSYSKSLCIEELRAYEQTWRHDLPSYLVKPEGKWFQWDHPQAASTTFNNDYEMKKPQKIRLFGYPLRLSNIKLYSRYMDQEATIKEASKYTTDSKICIFNDLARPWIS